MRQPAGFSKFILIWAVTMYAWESIAEALSTMKNPLMGNASLSHAVVFVGHSQPPAVSLLCLGRAGMMNYTGIWFSGFLYAGFLIGADDMVGHLMRLPHTLTFRSLSLCSSPPARSGPCECSTMYFR
jgi:hypothetical protein